MILSIQFHSAASSIAGTDHFERARTPFVCQIPLHGLAQRVPKSMPRPPRKLGFDLCGIDPVPPVVPRPVGNEVDQIFMCAAWPRPELVQQSTTTKDDIEVFLLASAANIVRGLQRRVPRVSQEREPIRSTVCEAYQGKPV